LKRPLLRFVLLGALLFAFDRAQPAEPIAHDPALDDDALLVAEALARDFHRSDDVVRRRLVQNLRFVRPDDGRSDAALLDEAVALGLHESDLVVRRRLAQKMRLIFAAEAHADEPGDEALRAYLEANAERFTEPARVRATQLYFTSPARAEAAQRQLSAAATGGPLPGDPLPLPRELPPHSQAELAARFGPGFAAGVFAGPIGRWFGPVASAYGHHLVFVHDAAPAQRSKFATVRSELREALLAERAAAVVEKRIAGLRGEE
jgi:peptidyl-prolyl cis-trans isomerase C